MSSLPTLNVVSPLFEHCFFLKIYLFTGCAGSVLRCLGFSLAVVCGPLTVVASLVMVALG